MNHILEKIENNKPLDFGDIFGKSIELFKKVWLDGFIHIMINILMVLPLFAVVYIPMIIQIGVTESNYGDYSNPIENLSTVMIVLFALLFLLVTILSLGVQLGIIAHFYRVCKKKDLDLDEEPSSYFMFLGGKYLKKTIVLSFMMFSIFVLSMLLCYLPLFYVMVPMKLLIVMYAFNPDFDASDLVKLSFKLGNKKWLLTFGLIIISSMLASTVGYILCFFGLFFTASFSFLPIYFIYKEVVGFEDEKIPDNSGLFIQ